MNWKKGLGIGFLFIGVFLTAVAQTLTGAVVGATKENYLGLFGVLMLVSGILFLYAGGDLEGRVRKLKKEGLVGAPKFFNRFDVKEKDAEKRSLILDTSAVLRYTSKELDKELKKYKNVFVPDSVLDEIYSLSWNEKEDFDYDPPGMTKIKKNDKELRRVIQNYRDDMGEEDYEKYREKSEEILERTDKPKIKRELLPYLNGKKEMGEGWSEENKITELTKRIKGIMAKEKGISDLEAAKKVPDYSMQEVRYYLENECDVTDADVDVFAMGLSEAVSRWHALIGEKDIDLRQAVEIVKAEYPRLGNNLDFVEPYEKEYETDSDKLKEYKKQRKTRLAEARKKKALVS